MVNMEINRVIEQMRTLSATLDQPVQRTSQTGQAGFGDVLKQAIDKVNEQQSTASALAKDFQTGDTNTSVAEVMVSMQKASLSFQAMTEVRNRLVDAYREIMNMPI